MILKYDIYLKTICVPLFIILFARGGFTLQDSCAAIGSCCAVGDASCVSEDEASECSCDQFCLSIGDCCNDYLDFCINRGDCLLHMKRNFILTKVLNFKNFYISLNLFSLF